METAAPPRKKQRYSAGNISRRAWIVRFFLRVFSMIVIRVLTRMRVEGLENIPDEGTPCIFAANHSSIYDAVLYFAYLPATTQYVGPGDFRLRYPNRIAAEWTDVILVDRGSRDTSSLRAMLDTLKSGGQIGLFPEGGTWEKGLYNVKDGAAYLSMAGQASIVPIAISGAYDLWRQIWTFQRPEVVMKILPPMQPVPKLRGQERRIALEKASIDLMHRIYEALEPDELERYKLYMKQEYFGTFTDANGKPMLKDGHNYSLLADLISKKNLFSTFHEHLKLPLRPFLRVNQTHSARNFKIAVDALYETLTGELEGYMTYRRGEKARQQIIEELAELSEELGMVAPETQLKFNVAIDVHDKDLSIEPPERLPEDVV